MALDLTSLPRPSRDDTTVGSMVRGLVGSEILRIAAEIRELVAKGTKVCNLTVGDFSPKEFPIPDGLRDQIGTALQGGETNYPPSDGVLDLRQAVQRFYERSLGLKYPLEGIVIAGGARPIIYATYRAVLDPGDVVVYPVPSWNNNHYAHMLGAKSVVVTTDAAAGFMPTLAQLEPHLSTARLLCLCSPLNPTGTMLDPEALRAICQRIVEENRAREGRGQKPLILMYDHIYWVLNFGKKHVTPVELVPEMAPYTVFVDGISKAFAATGVRVGWGVGAPTLISRMRDVLGHVGAWAPKAEQVATARYLDDTKATESFLQTMRQSVDARLEALYKGFQRMKDAGLPVHAIAPQGAIYLSVRFDVVGKDGLATNDAIRKRLLEKARFAVVPFQAFGLAEDTGWFRLSVGATSVAEIEEALPRVEATVREILTAK
ncbi:pyridoxal phosphate-dependent aminotransferase [Corallococcus carmarthensis]|uniref:Aminotransferase class I/II-fold pyridoxal phosphate-dependent enzyme n=1 Tax=Corallococcus carmarthensis TaxID=2316728 RepID=A0A3A8JWX6_9BACT|nr:aminotransferase class I/II-fold pyridoxal phosphate-dependent enzyme [Corallococcus carmarthensis]NOK17525.1 aminotransferase class I/II-fold pyridoxal phosphate-dependent enzyme [Corallococcus carmarthensis]RKH00468.1 aminotransferase class I/II-fold pyridoxal phosphate-dependent enzyme [Corallococcus carmarthensis]